ncbi:class F sortase [Streptomyces cinnamoneus]|uniref:Class F sortase n=1 Tax=Streptomyces cinnamoneus TaxID=53446 RepID=A0A2G1XFJ0_STRCJ|nr:class F sortase [Streptomyces cinnamoneus]PHQ49899.1 class F sortase [Streptomyces cinnamoneus]PPT13325.1 class F sortase [Streptomyces cinnamoneus]
MALSEAPLRGAGRLLGAVVWTVLLATLWLWGREITEVPHGTGPGAGGVTAARLAPGAGHRPLPAASPRELAIEAVDVHAPVEPHGLTPEGAVEPPPYERPGAVAWYRDGPPPGSAGAAVIVGHVDTQRAPAVFHRLGSLRRGARVSVGRADGTTAEFTVEDVFLVRKDGFDAEKVYGPRTSGRAELRLITCGGDYDHDRHAYSANVVVSAYLTGTTHTGGTGRV